jgi:hypothetical protein
MSTLYSNATHLRLRLKVTVGQEPKIELTLVWRLAACALRWDCLGGRSTMVMCKILHKPTMRHRRQ